MDLAHTLRRWRIHFSPNCALFSNCCGFTVHLVVRPVHNKSKLRTTQFRFRLAVVWLQWCSQSQISNLITALMKCVICKCMSRSNMFAGVLGDSSQRCQSLLRKCQLPAILFIRYTRTRGRWIETDAKKEKKMKQMNQKQVYPFIRLLPWRNDFWFVIENNEMNRPSYANAVDDRLQSVTISSD